MDAVVPSDKVKVAVISLEPSLLACTAAIAKVVIVPEEVIEITELSETDHVTALTCDVIYKLIV